MARKTVTKAELISRVTMAAKQLRDEESLCWALASDSAQQGLIAMAALWRGRAGSYAASRAIVLKALEA